MLLNPQFSLPAALRGNQAGGEVTYKPVQATPEDIERFMGYVEKLPNGCWFWAGARSRGQGNTKWYGSFGLKVDGKWTTVRSHRFSCDVLADPPKPCPPGHHRDHSCRFSLCIRPEHIDIRRKAHNEALRWERLREEDEFWAEVGRAMGMLPA